MEHKKGKCEGCTDCNCGQDAQEKEPNYRVGYCKECGAEVHEKDEMIPDYKGLYECPVCGHPHRKDELWEVRPAYLK